MAASEDTKPEVKSESDPEKEKALANSQITNSEDQKLLRARIFVGNLPADLRTEKGEIYDKFRKHGRIMGVSIHSRFAFVQFESEGEAKTAVKEENHSDFRSAKLELKMAIEGRVNNNRNRDDRDRRRSRSPIDRRRDSRDRDRGRRDSRERSRGRDSYRRRSRTRSPVYIPAPVESRFCHPRTYGANDVELVVIRKQQGPYAETILNRLYQCNITANVLFLAEHASLDGAVNEFGRCGTHYVVIIMPKHEETRAMTINMFEGTDKPREYRNLGIDEGISLISRHFSEHYPALARLRMAEIQGPHFYPPAPTEVARSMTRIQEMMAVPTSSLDSTIRYLQEMRERTAAFEGLASQPAVPAVIPATAAYGGRGMDVDMGIGKPYSGMDDRTRQMSAPSDSDNIRESLLGLLKASGGLPGYAGQPGVGAPITAPGGYGSAPGSSYPGYTASAYPAYSPATAASQAALASSMAGLSADPVALQKALASLGVLAPNAGGSGDSGTPSSVQQQHQGSQSASMGQQQMRGQQQGHRDSSSNVSSYRTSAGGGGTGSSQHEENGGGYGSQSQGLGGQSQQGTVDRSGGGGGGSYGQGGHVTSQQQYGQQNGLGQQGHLTAGQMATLRSMSGGGGQTGMLTGQNGVSAGGVSMYGGGGVGAGGGMSYLQQQQQQQQAQQPQQIQRSMMQQSQQATGYSGGSRR